MTSEVMQRPKGGTASQVEIAGSTIHYLRSGSGPEIWVAHHDIGNPGWLPFYDELAKDFTVVVPDLPGYGESERPDWMREVRDAAIAYGQLLDKVADGPVTLVGLGYGGWLAAELATMETSRLRRMALVAPMGLQPREGEIYDQFLVGHWDYILEGFHDPAVARALWGDEPSTEQLLAWDLAREMTTRIAWAPYMFSQRLEPFLGAAAVPTLIVWGDDDKIVPRVCGEQYVEALPDARLETVANAGHYVEIEQPTALANLIKSFAEE